MQKWEYQTILVVKAYGEERVLRVNDEPVADIKQAQNAFKYINDLGEQGWELVSEYRDSAGYQFVWEPGTPEVKKMDRIADDIKTIGGRIESITSFSWGATGPGGGLLIYACTPRSTLRFKRQKL